MGGRGRDAKHRWLGSQVMQRWGVGGGAGAKHQSLKSALTLFAQDGDSRHIIYANTDIAREDEPNEIMNFVDYWITVDLKKKKRKYNKFKMMGNFRCSFYLIFVERFPDC